MFSGWTIRSASGSWPIPDMAPAGNGRDLACSYLPESPGCDRSRLRQDPGWPTIVGKAHINPFPKRAIRASDSPSPQCWGNFMPWFISLIDPGMLTVSGFQTAGMSMRGNHAV
ncbi:hypothetical protein An11g01730 [Aspergillus niger]|uniref:Uncharacterized protein n=2 Tax=Aspergillus niger TaxID=5061 RepID=A2QVK3_ASPNC|nr:hypothetical protein An11g01730 [Aspergillus niger]CAK45907.1 hypothetical protein An11g01730 [Aspergillus niger]